MVIFVDGGILTTFRYKCLYFQANDKQNRKSKTPVAFLNCVLQRYLINTNSWQYTGFSDCLFQQYLQNISYCGCEHPNWWGWWLVWALLNIFGCSDNLCNDRYVYLVVLGGQGPISRCIVWFHDKVFKCSKRCDTVNLMFSCCYFLCETPFPCQIILLPKNCSMNRYVFKRVHNPFNGSFFDYYSSKRFKICHNCGEHMDDISTQNYKEIVVL